MGISAEDRVAVTELIAMHGHLTDDGELDRMDELFTADVVYDISDFGQEPLVGPGAIRDAALALGDANPVGHHVTNTVLTEVGADVIGARSKGIGIRADGTCGSVSYEDTVVRGAQGWRISRRKIVVRRTPLGGK